jgi:hypothetical protein
VAKKESAKDSAKRAVAGALAAAEVIKAVASPLSGAEALKDYGKFDLNRKRSDTSQHDKH